MIDSTHMHVHKDNIGQVEDSMLLSDVNSQIK